MNWNRITRVATLAASLIVLADAAWRRWTERAVEYEEEDDQKYAWYQMPSAPTSIPDHPTPADIWQHVADQHAAAGLPPEGWSASPYL